MIGFEDILRWLSANITVPHFTLAVLLGLCFWIFWQAQKSPEFDIVQLMTDENGKASASRFAILISVATTSYLMFYVTQQGRNGQPFSEQFVLTIFITYILTWSASKTIETIVTLWINRGKAAPAQLPEIPQGKVTVEETKKTTVEGQ